MIIRKCAHQSSLSRRESLLVRTLPAIRSYFRFGTLIFQLQFSTANICLQSILQPEHTLSTLFYLFLYNFNPNQILYWSSGPNSPSFGKACSVGNRHSIYSNLDFLKSKYFPHPKYPGSWVEFINASYMFCFIFVFTPHSRRFCCQIIFMTSKHIPNESIPKLTSFSCLSFPTVYNLCISLSHFEGESGSKNSTSFPCLFFWPLVFKDTFSLKVCHLFKFRSYPPWSQPPMCKAVSPSVSPRPWALPPSLTTCPHSCAATQPGQSQYEHFNICFSILAVFNMVNPLSWTGSFSTGKAWAGCETWQQNPMVGEQDISEFWPSTVLTGTEISWRETAWDNAEKRANLDKEDQYLCTYPGRQKVTEHFWKGKCLDQRDFRKINLVMILGKRKTTKSYLINHKATLKSHLSRMCSVSV